jgi:hypothetical protein
VELNQASHGARQTGPQSGLKNLFIPASAPLRRGFFFAERLLARLEAAQCPVRATRFVGGRSPLGDMAVPSALL